MTPPIIGVSSETQYGNEITPEQKAELAKNRRKEIRLIRKGDYYMVKNNPEEALTSYLEVLEKLPWDIIVEKKIANAYFAKKDWGNAYTNFTRVPISELKDDEKKKMFHALFFNEGEFDRLGELTKFPLLPWELEHYQIVDACYGSIDACIERILAYSGASSDMLSLKNTIQNASKISPDLVYRNFSLATEFYVQGEYRAAYELWTNILRTRSDYFDVQKLVGFSLFSLGRYTEAREMLKKYIEHVPTDLPTIIRLGELAGLQKDYVEANLYLNNAVNAGYMPKTDIERQLAYNYSQLWDTVAMVKVLSYLLSETGSVEDDFAVAISLAFARGENARAYVWSIEWLKKFPNSPIIAPLYMTALRIIWRGEDAVKFYGTLTGEVTTSPLILLELGINAYDMQDFTGAEAYFKEVTEIDIDADFGIEAENYLTQIAAARAEMEAATPVEVEEEKKGWWF